MKRFYIPGVPNEKQKAFFKSTCRYTAYGGARGGGKSWALRRKLVAFCLRYAGARCLIIRRSYAELKSNHIMIFQNEYRGLVLYSESEKSLTFPNKSKIFFGYCSCDRDTLRYQGQEYDVIAIDEATQLSEYQFSIFKACLRGTTNCPRRMYLTCNPGGIGHNWVKRLFIDCDYRDGENAEDYCFISARVYDNKVLLEADPEYVKRLKSLPPRLRAAWLDGSWNVFEGQFFPDFNAEIHVCEEFVVPQNLVLFAALDYGFDMLALLLFGIDCDGNIYVLREHCESGLTLSEAAGVVAEISSAYDISYVCASPDLWNRRQETGRSGFEIMQNVQGMPPMIQADNRRIEGFNIVHEYLQGRTEKPKLKICSCCKELIGNMTALLCSKTRLGDAANEPHVITHAPEALRYGLMSRINPPEGNNSEKDFVFRSRKNKIKNYLM